MPLKTLKIRLVTSTVFIFGAFSLSFGALAQAPGYPATQPQPVHPQALIIAPGQPSGRPVRVAPRQYMPRPAPIPQPRYAPQGSRYGHLPAQPRPYGHMQRPASHNLNFFERLFTRRNFNHYGSFNDRMRNRRLPTYQMRPPVPGALDGFQRWVETEPEYVLYPGDQVDVVVPSAPEISRTLTVGPDGRITMPMVPSIMAAGRTMAQIETEIEGGLAAQLVDPRVDVTPRAYGPQQIFIGGEVGQQGTYTLPGPIGVTEAVMMAGGFRTSAQTSYVVVLRRGQNGGFMARVIDFRDGLANPHSLADLMQLRRGDIIFVPRSNVAEVGLFMQQYVRDALPFTFNASYNFGNGFSN